MKRRANIFAVWGFGLFAAGAISVSFPAIAGKAADHRVDAQWAERAESFVKEDIERNVKGSTALITQSLSFRNISASHTVSFDDDLATKSLMRISPEITVVAKRDMSEHQCLAEAVYYEARSETRSGQIGVAEVIKNRVTSKHYPNSICDVVYQGSERRTGCQFSFTCDGSMDDLPRGKAWERSKEMASLSLNGFAPRLTDNATHYHTTNINPVWAPTLRYDGQIGSHKFYRFKWRERPVKRSVSMNVAPPI
jgi:spore germination cell wall hydrolase CwlJ-like protein